MRIIYPDTKDIRGTSDEGMNDESLWELAQSEQRLLITTDKGFSKYRYQQHHGIIIILLKHSTSKKYIKELSQQLKNFLKKIGKIAL